MNDPACLQSHPYDRSALTEKLGGDQALVHTLLGIAVRSSRQLPEELRQASALGDFAGLARIAHKVKGTAGDLVAVDLRSRAHDTELAARESSPAALGLGLQLADALDRLLAELRALCATE